MTWLINKESSGDPNAKNPKSTAHGLGQLLNSTWKTYGKGDRNNPVDQVAAMARYVKQRYGTPEAAIAFHQKNGWY